MESKLHKYLKSLKEPRSNTELKSDLVALGVATSIKSAEAKIRWHCKRYADYKGPELLMHMYYNGQVCFKSMEQNT